jgi:zinc/manganese transport system ATP-binding protein
MNVLRFDHLCVGFPGRDLIHDLYGRVEAGERVALIGPNGSGKSSLLKVLAGQERALFGRFEMPDTRPRDIAWLPQTATPDTSVPMSVFDIAMTGLWRRTGLLRGPTRGQIAAVMEALDRVGLADRAAARIGFLSGGEMQRLVFARAGLRDAKLMLLDEPFNGVDADTQAVLLDLMDKWSAEGRAIIAAIHDRALLSRFTRQLHIGPDGWSWHGGGAAAQTVEAPAPAVAGSNVVPMRLRGETG